MKTALRKSAALLLATLTLLSVCVCGLGASAADTYNLTLTTAFYTYNSESGQWVQTDVIHPNQAVKLRVGIDTDFDCNNGQIVLAFDKSVLIPTTSGGYDATLNTACATAKNLKSVYVNSSVDAATGLTKRLKNINNITEADTAKYGFIVAVFEPVSGQSSRFKFDGSDWLFEVDMTVADVSGKSAQALVLPNTVASVSNSTGYSVFYKFLSDSSNETEGSMVWYNGTPTVIANPAYVQAASETHTHTYTEQAYIPATCDKTGISVFICSCGAVQKYGIIPAGHKYGAFAYDGAAAKTHTKVCANDSKHTVTEACTFTNKVTTPATCIKKGVRTYTCSVCGGTYTEDISLANHIYSTAWSSDANTHWHACICDKDCVAITDSAPHSDADGDGCCDVCGKKFAEPYSLCTLKIRNNNGSNTVDYRNGIQLTAVTNPATLPENTKIVWYVNGTKAATGTTFVKTDIRSAFKVTVQLEDNEGKIWHDKDGNEIKDEEQINVKAGFFKKIIAFFRWLFKKLKTTVQSLEY